MPVDFESGIEYLADMSLHQTVSAFLHAVHTAIVKRNEFHGAASRAEFWHFQLFLLLVSNFFILPLDAIVFSYKIHSPISTIWLLLIVRFNASLTVRRLYDSGSETRWAWVGLGLVIGILAMIHSGGTWFWWLALMVTLGCAYGYAHLMNRESWQRDRPRGEQKDPRQL